MDPLILIPARSGSQGMPDKNFRPFAGGPSLLQRALVCARAIDGAIVVVSSDREGLALPPGVLRIHRDPHLAANAASMACVVLETLTSVSGDERQPILLVQPTQPLRTPAHLRQALAMLEHYPRVASVVETEPAQKLYHAGFVPVSHRPPVICRQDAERTYRCDGTVYGFWRQRFMQTPSFVTPQTRMLMVDPRESCPVDTALDWALAEYRVREKDYGYARLAENAR